MRSVAAMSFASADASGEMLCQIAMEQSMQRCARTRGVGADVSARAMIVEAAMRTADQPMVRGMLCVGVAIR
jgi:hypothetical protein